MIRRRSSHITAMLFLALISAGGPAHGDGVQDGVGRARSNSQGYSVYQVPDAVKRGTAQADEAQRMADVVNSPEYQGKVAGERQRLLKEVFGVDQSRAQGYYPDTKQKSGTAQLAKDERVYVFVSSSMPAATLRAYAQDIDRIGDPNITMVMRGFVGGISKGMPTMKFISRFLLKDPGCADVVGCVSFNAAVQIDPNLYRRFRPERVPAIVYAKGVRPGDPDMSEGIVENVPQSDAWFMVYGDASLGYVLGRINDEAHSPTLASVAKTISK